MLGGASKARSPSDTTSMSMMYPAEEVGEACIGRRRAVAVDIWSPQPSTTAQLGHRLSRERCDLAQLLGCSVRVGGQVLEAALAVR